MKINYNMKNAYIDAVDSNVNVLNQIRTGIKKLGKDPGLEILVEHSLALNSRLKMLIENDADHQAILNILIEITMIGADIQTLIDARKANV